MSVSGFLARRLFFPMHEWMRGRHTLREMRRVATWAAMTPVALAEDADERLRRLLEFCARELPFYRDRFAQHEVNPTARSAASELAKLSILRKPEVRDGAARMTWLATPGGLQPCVTGGTSGDTLHFFVDRVRQAQSMGARLFMQSLFGVRPGDRRMWLWGSPIELKRSRLRSARDRLINEIVLDSFDMSPEIMDRYLDGIERQRPRLLIGYSSSVALLAKRRLERRGNQRLEGLRAVVMTADEAPPAHRALAEEAFGCPVVTEYGCRETGLMAHECPQRRLHALTCHVRLEFLRGGEVTPAGEAGGVVCTNLDSRAQPLLRYSVGDLAAWRDGTCGCGLPFPLMELRGGRVTGFIARPDGRLCDGHVVNHIVRSDPAVVAFRVLQPSVRKLDVLLVIDPRGDDPRDGVRQRFQDYLGKEMAVECHLVDSLPADRSGKRRWVVSDVAAEIAGL